LARIRDNSAPIGAVDASAVAIPGGYSAWTSLYIANRESANSLALFKRRHLKDTDITATLISPRSSLNLFLAPAITAAPPISSGKTVSG